MCEPTGVSHQTLDLLVVAGKADIKNHKTINPAMCETTGLRSAVAAPLFLNQGMCEPTELSEQTLDLY